MTITNIHVNVPLKHSKTLRLEPTEINFSKKTTSIMNGRKFEDERAEVAAKSQMRFAIFPETGRW